MMRFLAVAALITLGACVSAPVVDPSEAALMVRQRVPAGGAGLNTYRRDAGLAPLARSPRLDRVARAHAADMAAGGFFSHRSSDGTSARARISALGCVGWAENIAEGPYSRRSVMEAWMRSPGHRRNMLLPAATHYGLANVGNKWVLTLSRDCP